MYRLLAAASLSLLILGISLPAAADSPSGFSKADRLILKGDSHYYDGDYYRAISAYQDFLWDHSGDYRADRVRLKKAWVYYSAEEYRRAARVLDGLAERLENEHEGWWARQYLGDVARDAERYPLARRSYESVVDLCEPIIAAADAEQPDPAVEQCIELVTNARLALADIHATIHDFDAAVDHLDALPDRSPASEEAVEIADLARDVEIPTRSPALAGTLSIIPGLGHFYIGEYRNGVLAMVWNGIFIYGLVDTILAGRVGQAILIGLLETIWYSGTIFGAVAGAHRYNRDARRVVEDGMRDDIGRITDRAPWPAQFPVDAPSYLELEIEF